MTELSINSQNIFPSEEKPSVSVFVGVSNTKISHSRSIHASLSTHSSTPSCLLLWFLFPEHLEAITSCFNQSLKEDLLACQYSTPAESVREGIFSRWMSKCKKSTVRYVSLVCVCVRMPRSSLTKILTKTNVLIRTMLF